jgi:uncharacterized coiled-coil protein SlyX
MPTPCEALATAAEVQELREQLNELLGKKEDGGKETIFEKGKSNLLIGAAGGLTLLGMAQTNAPSVITDIVMGGVGTESVWKDLANGKAQWHKVKGSGATARMPNMETLSKTAGQGAGAAQTATGVGATGAASLLLLATLVQIAGTLALNKATVDILGNRIDVESAGTQAALDQQNDTMLRLYQKNQGNFETINAQLAENDRIAAENRQTFAIIQADLQQNSLEIGTFNDKLSAAQAQINDLITQNNSHVAKINELQDDLVTVKADLTAQIEAISVQLTEAQQVIDSQQATITQLTERITTYEERLSKKQE